MHVGAKDVAQRFRTGGYPRDDEPVDGQRREGEGGQVGACDIDVRQEGEEGKFLVFE